MKLKIPQLGTIMEINPGVISCLVVENPGVLTAVVADMLNLCEAGEGDARLYEKEEEVAFGTSVELVVDHFRMEINERAVLSKIHGILIKTMQEELVPDMQEMRRVVCESVGKAISMHDLPLTFKLDFALGTFLKAVEVKVDDSGMALIERICLYLSLAKRFSRQKLFIFVGLRQFLSDDDYDSLVQNVRLDGLYVLLLERSFIQGQFSTGDKQALQIVDNDLCFIL